jgi:ACR3 family arsenite efflux pump ArsB
MFEVVVTLGVSAWAWSLASASRQPAARWGVLTCVGAFVVHRACAWVVALTIDPNDVFSSSGQVWRMVGPFLGSVVVFVATPVVLGMAIRERPPRRAAMRRP